MFRAYLSLRISLGLKFVPRPKNKGYEAFKTDAKPKVCHGQGVVVVRDTYVQVGARAELEDKATARSDEAPARINMFLEVHLGLGSCKAVTLWYAGSL